MAEWETSKEDWLQHFDNYFLGKSIPALESLQFAGHLALARYNRWLNRFYECDGYDEDGSHKALFRIPYNDWQDIKNTFDLPNQH